ncbi:MAG: hypothetical protein WA350_00595, partial [Candidatus Sulfotelmatobacter sp.]
MLHIGLRQFVKVPIALNADKNTTENADPCVSQSRRPPLKQIFRRLSQLLPYGLNVTVNWLPLRLQEEDSQGWKCQIQRERLAICGYGFGEHTSGVPLITTTVGSGITVQKFAPIPPFRHAYAMVVSHHRREVSNYR